MLLSDEIARREQQRFATRLRRAAFQTAKTIEQFDFERNLGLNRSLVNDVLTCRFIGEAAPVHIVGPVGTGKSHLAQAIGHQAVKLGHEV
ncbi:MAG: ATP-binding protein, partial [Betaproteobacteria bacterium]|nr:ATP-binding protein [Betaproteobacteria bacterium]